MKRIMHIEMSWGGILRVPFGRIENVDRNYFGRYEKVAANITLKCGSVINGIISNDSFDEFIEDRM